jgi:hypothetical protein
MIERTAVSTGMTAGRVRKVTCAISTHRAACMPTITPEPTFVTERLTAAFTLALFFGRHLECTALCKQ